MAKIGLVLSGGGARGAYQAGVLKAIGEICRDLNKPHPIPIITGISAGAINAAYMASMSDNFPQGSANLAALWAGLTTSRVFRTDPWSLLRTAVRLVGQMVAGGMYRSAAPQAFLDTEPLHNLLRSNVTVGKITSNLAKGYLDSVAITVTDYASGGTLSFVQSQKEVELWSRARRASIKENVHTEHVMASAALPILFPAIKLGNKYYGDGSLRNTAPISPALHLGADRLIIINVRKEPGAQVGDIPPQKPSIGRVLGVALNALLMDSTTTDLERMERINRTLSLIPESSRTSASLRPIKYLAIHPSEDIGMIARKESKHLPTTIRYLIAGLGSKSESSDLVSYLLFESAYTSRLVDMGYADGMRLREKIVEILTP